MARGRKKASRPDMKRANGTGCIRKLSGNRRKPFQVMITVGYDYDVEAQKARQKMKQLGTYATIEDAERALDEYNNNPFDFDTASVTFGQLYLTWSDKKYKKLSHSTITSYSSAYKHCKDIENVKIKDLKTMHLQSVIDNCEQGYNTKSNIKVIMSAVFEYAEMNDIVSKNYAKFIEIGDCEPTFQREVFTKEEISELWKLKDDCYVQIILILLYSGMRVNELLKMKRECCNLEEQYLYVASAKNKTSIRKVPIHGKIYDMVKAFYDKGKTLLITNAAGYSVPYNNFASRQFKRLMQDKGWEHRIHDTRHTFISRAKECKLDELYLKRIVGHTTKDITTTVYTHIKQETLLNEIQKLKY